MSLIEVKCPMCKGTLWIDPSSGEVVDHKADGHKKIDFQSYMKEQKQRGSALEEKMRQAKEQEDKRRQAMDEKFKAAKERPDDIQGEYHSPFEWD